MGQREDKRDGGNISIAVADDLEGPFRLEIRGVEALREDDGLG